MLEECQLCGACCFSESSAYVPATKADRARLGRDADSLTCEEDGRHYMVMIDDHCAALSGAAGMFSCAVYGQRPAACRELDRGTPACREERKLKRRGKSRLALLRC